MMTQGIQAGVLALVLPGVCAAQALPSVVVANLDGPTVVMIANVGERTVGSRQIYSSSQLSVTWRAPSGYAVDHYEVTAAESIFGTSVTTMVSAEETATTLTGLKAVTPYSVTVKACSNDTCTESGVSSPALGMTSEEYWQLQGSGSSVAGLTRIVVDGNARISATRFGSDADGVNASRIQLYYGPSPMMTGNRSTLATAVTSVDTDTAVPASYLSFTSMATTTGLVSPRPTATLVATVNTGQGVPLSTAMGGTVRLYFEATGGDGRTRILYLDSQDGYSGRDFNSGSSGICSNTVDYQAGGCVPDVAIGVEGDAVNGNDRIGNARQFKLGYPILDDWRWNGEAGTFMVFTTDQLTGNCGRTGVHGTHGYAVWSGSGWQVQYDAAGCPKLFTNVQAMFPVHVGEARYKMYFGDPSIQSGRGTSNFPFLGPKKLIYADGRGGGNPGAVDFEDWEPTTAGRDVAFVWPNGDPLNESAEGFIDDFHFLSPTGSLDLQVMYMAITDGSIAPIGAAAVLLNP